MFKWLFHLWIISAWDVFVLSRKSEIRAMRRRGGNEWGKNRDSKRLSWIVSFVHSWCVLSEFDTQLSPVSCSVLCVSSADVIHVISEEKRIKWKRERAWHNSICYWAGDTERSVHHLRLQLNCGIFVCFFNSPKFSFLLQHLTICYDDHGFCQFL